MSIAVTSVRAAVWHRNQESRSSWDHTLLCDMTASMNTSILASSMSTCCSLKSYSTIFCDLQPMKELMHTQQVSGNCHRMHLSN